MTKDPRETALAYLSYRARTAEEVRKHLKEKGFGADEAEETLIFLQDDNFIDDNNYCKLYIEYAIEKGRGPLRIAGALAEKGVAAEIVRAELEECLDSETERELAMTQAEKFFDVPGKGEDQEENHQRVDERTLARLGRRLAAQGFHANVIYDVLAKFRR